MKTSSKQSKPRDLQLKWLHRETNDIHFIIESYNCPQPWDNFLTVNRHECNRKPTLKIGLNRQTARV